MKGEWSTMDDSNGGVLGCTAVSVIENEGGENFVAAITLNGALYQGWPITSAD